MNAQNISSALEKRSQAEGKRYRLRAKPFQARQHTYLAKRALSTYRQLANT